MKLNWFKQIGIFYWPISIFGWLIAIIAIVIAANRFIAIDMHSHSVSDTLITFAFNLLLIWLVYTVIAWLTRTRSRSGKN